MGRRGDLAGRGGGGARALRRAQLKVTLCRVEGCASCRLHSVLHTGGLVSRDPGVRGRSALDPPPMLPRALVLALCCAGVAGRFPPKLPRSGAASGPAGAAPLREIHIASAAVGILALEAPALRRARQWRRRRRRLLRRRLLRRRHRRRRRRWRRRRRRAGAPPAPARPEAGAHAVRAARPRLPDPSRDAAGVVAAAADRGRRLQADGVPRVEPRTCAPASACSCGRGCVRRRSARC